MKTTFGIGLFVILSALSWTAAAQTVTAPEPAPARQQDRLLSRVYAEQAATALAKKEWSTAATLLRAAIEFDPRNSDAYYLRGQLSQANGGNIHAAITSFREALDYAEWSLYRPFECEQALAPLLIRTKHYEQALTLLQGMGTTSADYLYEEAQALIGAGNDYQARNLLQQALSAFPGDQRFMTLRIQIDPYYRQSMAAQYLAAANSASIPQGLLAALITNTTSAAEKQRLIALYDSSFPPSPVVFAQSLLASSAVTPAEIDRFASEGLLSNGRLPEELYAHLAAGAAKSRLAQFVADYTGKVTLDTNGDGYAEETADYSAGKLVRLSVDFDQDGVPKYQIDFSKGVPSSVTVSEGAVVYKLTYGSYPFLGSAFFQQKEDKLTYTLEPERISFPLFGASSSLPGGPGAFPPLVKAPPPVSKKALFAFASQVESTSLATGQPVSLWKKSISDILLLEKQWQSGRYTYRAVYHHGQEYSAEIDVDNDGYYEVHELFRNGKLWKLTYDGDRDGIPDFTLILQPYPILSWDFNHDGLPDEVEKRISPNTTILEFSTKMNGVFDVVTKEVKK